MEADKVLISVVVPVYNVEKYIAKCLDSLLSQDFEQYEIVVVNDGSTDSSGEICDRYSKKHDKLVVLHKVNGGLSDARNYGVLHARGSYVTFVDGDDYVLDGYLRELCYAAHENDADLVVSKLKVVKESDRLSKKGGDKRDVEVIDRSLMPDMLLWGDLPISACGKLILRSHCLAHPFPKGMFNEDIAVMADYYRVCSRCAFVGEYLYAYVCHPGSITKSKSMSIKKAHDLIEASRLFEDSCCKMGQYSRGALAYCRLLYSSRLYSILVKVDDNKEEANSIKSQLMAYAKREMAELDLSRTPFVQYVRFKMLTSNECLYRVVFWLYEKVRKGL